ERVALGPLAAAHVPLVQRWLNDFQVARTLGHAPLPIPLDAERAWFERTLDRDDRVHFAIYELPQRPIGFTHLHPIDTFARSAQMGIVIGERDARGRGLGTEATRLLARYAGECLGLATVGLEVLATHAQGIRAYERAGFVVVGRRAAAAIAGRPQDLLI